MLKLASVFTNHMVLQRGKRIAVWGGTDGTAVTLSMNGVTVQAKASDGTFQAEFPPMTEGGPYILNVTAGWPVDSQIWNWNSRIVLKGDRS